MIPMTNRPWQTRRAWQPALARLSFAFVLPTTACGTEGSSFCDEYQENIFRIRSECGTIAQASQIATETATCRSLLEHGNAGNGTSGIGVAFDPKAADACISALKKVKCSDKCFDTTTCIYVFEANWSPSETCDFGCFGSKKPSFCW